MDGPIWPGAGKVYMKLTRYERTVLANQYRMLELMTDDGDECNYYRRLRAAVEQGFESDYFSDDVYRDEHVLTADDTQEVLKILSMFDAVDRSIAGFGPGEADGVNTSRMTFRGFDANSESTRLGYVRYLCENGRTPARLSKDGDDFNSHVAMLDAYRRMMEKWIEMGQPDPMSAPQLLRLTDHMRHPSP